MSPVIRTALQGPQIILVLAVLLLVTDAVLAILSPVSAAADPDRLYAARFPGTEMLLEAPHDDVDWLLPAKTCAGNGYTELTFLDKEAAPLISHGTMYLSTPHDGALAPDAGNGNLFMLCSRSR